MDPEKILEILEKTKGFSWNKGNIDKNWLRHQVTSKECEEVFFNRPLLVNFDEKHSNEIEKRFQASGKTNRARNLFIVFIIRDIRDIRDKKIRIISVRDQSKKERRQYAKEKA